ncbi:rho-related protein racA-like isoform X1 [Stylophora pistillata]|uniref:rho-related protein racA-like isoform X1 n=1 Tax=Stylophora pistillata TaxID=50429 RepID=UPI000C04F645|nr:rho-related protein racA-like isoform X1 [Stylophora pistillata]
MQNLKLVVIGDGGVGKSCFLISATTSRFPGDYVPTVFDNYNVNLPVNGSPCSVSLWDTAGQEDYDRLRFLSYPGTDVFVVCFDVANRSSFENVNEKWVHEARYYEPETPILLLATKTDLRNSRSTVSTREGMALAETLGVSYAECSSITNTGVQEALNKAAEMAVSFNTQSKSSASARVLGLFKRKSKNSTSVKDQENLPPELPPAGFAPHVEVLSSTFASEWNCMMSDTMSADVRFVFSDGESLEAHRTVLIASSSIFKNVLVGKMSANHKSFQYIFEDVSWICDEADNCLNLPHIEGKCQGKGKTVIRLHESITKGVFSEVLSFLYTGSPNLSDDDDKNFITEIQDVAKKFQMAWLIDTCTNILSGDSFLNPSIGTWLNDNTGQTAKKLFLNKPFLADVKFCVEGMVVYGHKLILKARSEVMAAMLGGAFRESDLDTEIEIRDTTLQSFLALLEYLYTDHAPIEEGDSVEIMVLADRFCLPRLVTMCELYTTKKVDSLIQKRVADGTKDVINLLLTSQAYNAKQLADWCLHFISTNFSVFESTEEFELLQGDNRKHVTEHRWPPLSYLQALEEFEQRAPQSKLASKCKVM